MDDQALGMDGVTIGNGWVRKAMRLKNVGKVRLGQVRLTQVSVEAGDEFSDLEMGGRDKDDAKERREEKVDEDRQ